ncbi:hypothetical protein ACSBR2_027838 [Camellia fascicularis]
MANFGCASGPNAFMPIWNVIESIHTMCRQLNHKPPALQVPKGLTSELGIPLNKGNIYIAKTSPPGVCKAYLDQFEKDLTAFLRSRSEETIPGGLMVLIFVGRNEDPDYFTRFVPNIWELFGMILNDMVIERLIEASKPDSFNMPLYTPSAEEAQRVIQREGLFSLRRLETFKLRWDANIDNVNKGLVFDKYARGKAVGESILVSQFVEAIMDDLLDRLTKKVAEYLDMGKGVVTTLIISLTKD